MKHILFFLLFFLSINRISSQNNNFFPLSSENINFTIDNFYSYHPNPHYLVLKDSIIFTYNNNDKRIYFSSDYGVNFKNIKFSSIFKTDDKQILNLYKRDDDVLITFNDGKQNLFKFKNNDFYSNEINFEPRPFGFNASYFNFKNKILIKLNNKIYIENEKKWFEYKIPSQNNIVCLNEYKDYVYVFHVDNKTGIAENNGILKSKDLITWENVEIGLDLKEKLFHNNFKVNALTDGNICFRDDKKLNNFYDLNKQKVIEINGLSNISLGSRTGLNIYIPYQIYKDKVYVFINGKLSSINFDSLTLNDELVVRGSYQFNFYYSEKFGIFNVNEIYYFDNKLLSKRIEKENILKNISLPETKTNNITLPALNLNKQN